MTIAFLFFFGYDLSLNVVAAILTITGYSVNDTIVIFDRVRENLRTKRRDSLEKVVNQSVNQTLSRTIITAGTTFLAVLALYLFGGEVLEGVCVHDAGRHHQRHVLDDLHRGGDRDHPWQQAGQGTPAELAQGFVDRRVDLISAALLGVVQGLTEFLPVSSSGHLILARAFFGWDPGRFGIAFDAACHVGTLLAVVAFFRAEVTSLVIAAPGALTGKDGEWERLGRLIIVGTIPIVIVGGLFGDVIEARVRTPLVVAVNLVIGAIGLMLAERVMSRQRDARSLGYGEALAIGIAQAAALAPGLSRSGSTLSVACFWACSAPTRRGSCS